MTSPLPVKLAGTVSKKSDHKKIVNSFPARSSVSTMWLRRRPPRVLCTAFCQTGRGTKVGSFSYSSTKTVGLSICSVLMMKMTSFDRVLEGKNNYKSIWIRDMRYQRTSEANHICISFFKRRCVSGSRVSTTILGHWLSVPAGRSGNMQLSGSFLISPPEFEMSMVEGAQMSPKKNYNV
jgi:hypothetical protein